MNLLVNNLAITGVCLFLLGFYFNWREKKLESIAGSKLKEIREKYITQIAERKAREKKEIEKLKGIVESLEKKHMEILKAKKSAKPEDTQENQSESKELLQTAQAKAKEIEQAAKDEAEEYLDEQKKEVQGKMVDLVMGVTKKVITKSLNYEDHKELIEKAFQEVEGEVSHDDGD